MVVLSALAFAAPCGAGGDGVTLERVLRRYERSVLWGLRRAPEIDVSRVLDLADGDGVILVDVRSDEERKVSTIPGAISLDAVDAERQLKPEATVVVYCTIGARSAAATRDLRTSGVEAFNLVGGVLAWAHAGQTFDRDGESTTTVHVHSRSWDLLPDGYEAVW